MCAPTNPLAPKTLVVSMGATFRSLVHMYSGRKQFKFDDFGKGGPTGKEYSSHFA